MPRASVSVLPPRRDLTRSVGIVALVRYSWFTCLYLLFLTTSFGLLIAVIVESFFDHGSRTSNFVESHLWHLLGFTTGSGGIGLYMKRLNKTESDNMLMQQLMDSLERLPDSKQKEKALLDCVRVLVKKPS